MERQGRDPIARSVLVHVQLSLCPPGCMMPGLSLNGVRGGRGHPAAPSPQYSPNTRLQHNPAHTCPTQDGSRASALCWRGQARSVHWGHQPLSQPLSPHPCVAESRGKATHLPEVSDIEEVEGVKQLAIS